MEPVKNRRFRTPEVPEPTRRRATVGESVNLGGVGRPRFPGSTDKSSDVGLGFPRGTAGSLSKRHLQRPKPQRDTTKKKGGGPKQAQNRPGQSASHFKNGTGTTTGGGGGAPTKRANKGKGAHRVWGEWVWGGETKRQPSQQQKTQKTEEGGGVKKNKETQYDTKGKYNTPKTTQLGDQSHEQKAPNVPTTQSSHQHAFPFAPLPHTPKGRRKDLAAAVNRLDVPTRTSQVAFAVFAAAYAGRVQADGDCRGAARLRCAASAVLPTCRRMVRNVGLFPGRRAGVQHAAEPERHQRGTAAAGSCLARSGVDDIAVAKRTRSPPQRIYAQEPRQLQLTSPKQCGTPVRPPILHGHVPPHDRQSGRNAA